MTTLSTTTPLLDVRNLQTEFVTDHGVVKAVNDVSFAVSPGETLGIVGESGSGKTVTMLTVMQLIAMPPGRIVGGEVLFNGVDLLKMRPSEMRKIRGSKIAMIFQDPLTSLNPVFTVGEQLIETIRAHLKLSRKAARDHAQQALSEVGIADPSQALSAFPHQFSGGMRQRVMIAMTIACDPALLIADEPTTALDVTVQDQILRVIDDLRSRLNMAIIWITHDLGIVAGLADRVLVMYAGEIVEQGITDKLYENPRHPYTQGLLQSIPRLDVPRSRRLQPIPGTTASLFHLPPGCQFAPRCAHRVDQCAEHPPLIDLEAGHGSRCWVNPEPASLEAADHD
jgi:oligopeptide transport system ATP-binding protein